MICYSYLGGCTMLALDVFLKQTSLNHKNKFHLLTDAILFMQNTISFFKVTNN